MKKFERLPAEERKAEIMQAALRLFNEKGFSATTMENIVSEVSLSKGGVYRLYPSTTAILSDLMIGGMHMRNSYYRERAGEELRKGRKLTLETVTDMITDSLLMAPEVSNVYAEFLWEKRRRPELESLFREIERKTVGETMQLIRECGAEELVRSDLETMTELMNAFTLGISILGSEMDGAALREKMKSTILALLSMKKENEKEK